MSQTPYELADKRVWVAGHRGMVGAALLRRLHQENCEALTVNRDQLDLRDAAGVASWLKQHRPDVVILAAAKVGGILANDTERVAFLLDNLKLETNVIGGAAEAGVDRLVFLGSSCVYPKFANQPISESSLLTGALEPTNQWYAVAKIAGLKLCEAYFSERGLHYSSVMPTNLFGPGDNFAATSSHVMPALMQRIHEAKVKGSPSVALWGTGQPRREFLHVDDCADAIVHATKFQPGGDLMNVGTGKDITIAELAKLLAEVIGWQGQFLFDTSKPDGTPRKLLDVSKLERLGWKPKIPLAEGIRTTYAWYTEQLAGGSVRH
jgi:GDP-L-fucose synthase